MALPGRQPPLPYLVDRRFWQARMDRMDGVRRGLLILPRSDLSSPFVDVVEWRMRAHDGQRLWGLRALSPFHTDPKGVHLREVAATELPTVRLDTVVEGRAEFVLQVPAGRRLEDRVLDVLRVVQVALSTCRVDPEQIRLDPTDTGPEGERVPDEFLIVERLMRQGICSLP
jgi:hypothetical protein